jgi:hypothetical protein
MTRPVGVGRPTLAAAALLLLALTVIVEVRSHSADAFVRDVTGNLDAVPGSCPSGVNTACSSNATCCPIFMSATGWVAARFSNIVCLEVMAWA